ncbi:uncharacterized protein A4U43_C05F15830 [Asparagus officinalis]|uniref:EF-hand domain-containing protein n=1 Tax=Asparagus officinalis TaxID=4686 RepID=A0A5P1EW93_ASPOF|nr:putative calcium-binding protein CML19 [Asparagus officinalis]ONK68771.1 uncharacterized protein A4U43_C05F15830 [Asparagus officinalis]
MMLTQTMREATAVSTFFSNFISHLSPKNRHKPKPNQLHVPNTLPALSTTTPSTCSNKLKRIFQHFDEDGDGKISPTELTNCMRTVGEELTIEDARAVFESMDSDCDGLLGFEDFVRLVEVEGEEEKGRSLREAFGVYEMEGQDCITPKSLRKALERILGQPKSEEECEEMVRRFDLDGDGVISFDEFRVMML